MSQTSSRPEMTVVIPLFNKGPHIAQTLRSALAQTTPAAEILVVDDASTDDGLAQVRAFDDPRIRVLRRDEPGPGGYAARNLAIREARTDWIAFLDADDEWRPDHLERLSDALAGSDAGCAFSSYVYVRGDQRRPAPVSAAMRANEGRPVDLTVFLEGWIETGCPIWTGACAFRRDVLVEAGLFPAGRARRGGDKDLWLRAVNLTTAIFVDARTAEFNMGAVNKVTQSTSVAEPPVILGSIEALLAGAEPRRAGLLRRLANWEIWRYARQNLAAPAFPRELKRGLHLPSGWREWTLITLMELAPYPIRRGLLEARNRGRDS